MAFRKIPLDSLANLLPERIHVFICSASFERRSTVIAEKLNHNLVDHAIVCANQVAYTSLIEERAKELCGMFGSRSSRVQISLEDPLIIADQIQRKIRELPEYPSTTYAIDITCFTHEALLIVLRILHARVKPSDRIICLYNGATDYSLGLSPREKWLTKGVGEIRSVLGYPGQIVPTQKIHLIVLVGFETERAERIIAAYEPSELTLGYGSPLESISLPLHDLNKNFHKKLSDKYKRVSHFMFSCEDAVAAKESLEKQVGALPDFNVFVAPMNTNISTVGVALAAFENPAIQVCYATAEQYNFEAYSEPSSECYLFEVPLLSTVIA
jgi:hypothetical protein